MHYLTDAKIHQEQQKSWQIHEIELNEFGHKIERDSWNGEKKITTKIAPRLLNQK